MDTKCSTLCQLIGRSKEIQKHKNFENSVLLHFSMLEKKYAKKNRYVNHVFKSARLFIYTTIMVVYHTAPSPSIKAVKEICKKSMLMSFNTIDSYLDYLRLSGRITVFKSTLDKRMLEFKPSRLFIVESNAMIDTFLIPYGVMFEDSKKIINRESYLSFSKFFFMNYSVFLFNDIHLTKLVDGSNDFISKDAGHTLMTGLFIASIRQKNLTIEYNYFKASHEYGISRSHIKRCFTKAESEGLVSLDKSSTKIYLKKKFIDLIYKYFSVHFAMLEHSINSTI